jgi:molecular chaperone HtpG
MSANSENTNHYEIKIDLQGLIRLLAKNLYAEADVFVREMIQNAHDSIKRRGEIEQHEPTGSIRIRVDRQNSTITITDNGSGLTEQEIHDYLSTIGRSGTGEFRQELINKGRQELVTLIGQFGIGLLSAFVVAYKVEVETLSLQPNSPAWLWVSEGQKDYELCPGDRHEIGTTVTLHISDNYRDMLNLEELHKAIKKYADFIPFPIYLNDEQASVNVVNPPWHRRYATEKERLDEYWLFINKRFPDYPLEVIPVELETPYKVEGALYISDRHVPDLNTSGMIDIYQTRMFITSNSRDMLPAWAKFVRGVIDSPALTPTAARDAIQLDETAREIKKALGDLIVRHLQNLAESNPMRFERIMEWHSYHVKGMAVTYNDFFKAVADLVPFETNRGLMSLRRYIELVPRSENKTKADIFYFSERGSATQYYMLCNAKGLSVINAGYIFEEKFLRKYEELNKETVKLHLISGADSEFLFEKVKPELADDFRLLELDFRRPMLMLDPASQIRVAYFKPTSLPAVTVLTGEAKLREELEQTKRNLIMPESVRDLATRILEERPTLPIILYLNADNPTIQQMAQMAHNRSRDPEAYQSALLALYNNAMLLAHHLMTPDDAQLIFASSNQTIKLLIDRTEQLNETQTKLSATQLELQEKNQQSSGAKSASSNNSPKHIICFLATPSDNENFKYRSILTTALRTILEQAPYYWQVVRADEMYYDNNVDQNIVYSMKRAQVYIADITELDPEVMMQLGYMRWGKASDQPMIMLQRGSVELPRNLPQLAGTFSFTYPNVNGPHTEAEIVKVLRAEFEKKKDIQELNKRKQAHYLAPAVIEELSGLGTRTAQAVARAYSTMEEFSEAEKTEISAKVSELKPAMVNGLQDSVKDLLKKLKG